MGSCEQNLSGDGLWEVSMQNRHLRLSVLADAGGKISELIDLRSGRNWLWRNPHIPFKALYTMPSTAANSIPAVGTRCCCQCPLANSTSLAGRPAAYPTMAMWSVKDGRSLTLT